MNRAFTAVQLQRDGRVFVQPYSRTVTRSLQANGLPIVLPSSQDAVMLGQTIRAALQTAWDTVLPARDPRVDPPDRELLDWLGLPDYAAYARGVRSVGVHWFLGGAEPNHLLVTPEDNGGPRTGFTPLREHRVTLTDFTPSVIGEAVQLALTLAT
jgi:hypothetical protein